MADDTEMDHLIDDWGHTMLREGKYTPGQIDAKWTKEMIEQFNAWLEKKGSKLRMPVELNGAARSGAAAFREPQGFSCVCSEVGFIPLTRRVPAKLAFQPRAWIRAKRS